MRHSAIILTASLFLLTACASERAALQPGPAQLPSPALTPSNKDPIQIDMWTLRREYLENEVAANLKYKGKLLAVKGDVGTVTDRGGERTVVFNWATGDPPVLSFAFDESEIAKLAELRGGQHVVIEGVCAGINDRQVVELKHSRIAEIKK